MSTLKGTTMHPRCRHIGETCLNVDFSSSAQVKIKVKFNFKLKKKKNWFPCCSTREDLSVDVSITYVRLLLTKPRWFLFSAYGNSGYGQNSISSISNFLKKITFLGFHGVVLVKTFPLMYKLLMQDWYWRSYGDFSSSSKIKIRTFLETNLNFWVPMV